MVLKLSVTMTC